MKNLNENEREALEAILDTCDELDGDYFTRKGYAMVSLMGLFHDEHVAGGYYTDLMKKGYLDEEEDDGYGIGVWVNA